MTSGASRHRLPELDVLRGFAALWVVLSHYLPFWNRYLGQALVIVPNSWGEYAVKLFFVISGYVILMTLNRCASLSEFIVNRVSRLFPTYWAALALAVGVGVLVFDDPFWAGGILANATMLQDYLGYARYDNVYWSLAVELTFYVLAGCLMLIGLRASPSRLVLPWLIASCVWALFAEPVDPDKRGIVQLLLALDYSPYFTMGIVFHEAVKSGWTRGRVAMLALAGVTEFMISGWPGLFVAAVCAILFWFATNGHMNLLVSRFTIWLGAISYALYLVHRNLGYHLLTWLHEQGFGPLFAVTGTLCGALGLATIITFYVERPASAAIRSWFQRQSAN